MLAASIPSAAFASVELTPPGSGSNQVIFYYDYEVDQQGYTLLTTEGPNSTGSPLSPNGKKNPLTATITSIADGVEIFLESNLIAGENNNPYRFQTIVFNIEPTPSIVPPVGCTFTSSTAPETDLCGNRPTGSGQPWLDFTFSENNVNSLGSGLLRFDFGTDFPVGITEAAPKFNNTDTLKLTLKASGLTANDFLFANSTNPNNRNDVCTAAKIVGSGSAYPPNVGTPCTPPKPVPGPLPIFGAAAAFGYSRRIRARIQSARQQATIS